MNPVKLWNLKKIFDLGAWGLEAALGTLGLKRGIKQKFQNPSLNFQNQDLIFSRIIR